MQSMAEADRITSECEPPTFRSIRFAKKDLRLLERGAALLDVGGRPATTVRAGVVLLDVPLFARKQC